jgi:PAP2 superfamily
MRPLPSFISGVSTLALCALSFTFASGLEAQQGFKGNVQEALGNRFNSDGRAPKLTLQSSPRTDAMSTLMGWHDASMFATGLDHTPVASGEQRVFGEQLGPCRAARAIAIVHIAMYDSIVALTGGYASYSNIAPVTDSNVSLKIAIAQASHDALVALFPSQKVSFDQMLSTDLANTQESTGAVQAGIDLGKRAAAAILALRSVDGSQQPEMKYGIDYIPSTLPGKWRQDPISHVPIALGVKWGSVKPFVMTAGSQFRLPEPPAFTSDKFVAAYNEVKTLGGDSVTTATTRNADQTETGIYWAYDGVPTLCAPPRLYNQIMLDIDQEHPKFKTQDHIHWRNNSGNRTKLVNLARYMALVNTAMADAAIAAWDSKYFHNLGRPITVIREGVGNPVLNTDPNFVPLGAQATNLTGPNFTPPFPSYPSGHATFGGALFQTIRLMKGGDKLDFTFVSDELNGETRNNQGQVRPRSPRHFKTLTAAETENGRSRVYLGIHWNFDSTDGISMGNQVANYVFAHAFRPTPCAHE